MAGGTSGPCRAGSGGSVTVHLPVLREDVARADSRLRRRRRTRAVVLAGVWLLMIGHVVHWAVTGRSVAPFVLSDSMKTLELGEINPGFILFAAALLVTLVFGRFMCGWVCHMGSLQDLCAWMLRRLGVRPRLFKARLLGYVPLVLALYMFVWPTAKRIVLIPALERVWPEGAGWFAPSAPFPGWSTRLMTTDLWAGLPSVAVAVPFLLLCGCATVYFLGARGLCRYGCPYGGFFLPAEQCAVGRITVNADLCDGCGRCTAACTSGVRVLEETKAFGFVVDQQCVRSLDCVAACPHEALSLSWSRPAILKGAPAAVRPRERFDLGLGEELGIIGVGATTFVATRGLYGVIPLLLSVTMSVLSAFVVWRAARLLRERDARFGGLQLKRAGNMRPAGWAFLTMTACILLLIVHSLGVRAAQWRGDVLDGQIRTTREQAFGVDPAGVSERDRTIAADALRWYGMAAAVGRGGFALADTRECMVREAWLGMVAGEPARAQATLGLLIREHGGGDSLVAELARVRLFRGEEAAAATELEQAVSAGIAGRESRELLVQLHAGSGRLDRAEEVARLGVAASGATPDSHRLLGWVLLVKGNPAGAAEELKASLAGHTGDVLALELLASARLMMGDTAGALDALEGMVLADVRAAAYCEARGVELLEMTGQSEGVAGWRARMARAASAKGRFPR